MVYFVNSNNFTAHAKSYKVSISKHSVVKLNLVKSSVHSLNSKNVFQLAFIFLQAFWLKRCRLRAMQNILKGKVAIQHLKII